MKAKVIKVDYRKESESFPDWMKFEITLLNEDGSEEVVPAYGKDLQHALSRVVKSRKSDHLKEKTKKIPQEVWILLTFVYITMISIPANLTKNPMWVILGLAGMAALLFGFKLYLTNKK